jgi:dTDP-4-dehydrorhamnose 3,5-epimerase-like enzyme
MKIEDFKFNIMRDEECECGSLIAIEEMKNIPFEMKRVFFIYGVDSKVSRGAHAHRASNQVLIAISGSCEILFDDGKERKKILLDSPDYGLYQNSMIWGEMHNFSKDCILMVISDDFYDPDDYIRDYDEFLSLCKEQS